VLLLNECLLLLFRYRLSPETFGYTLVCVFVQRERESCDSSVGIALSYGLDDRGSWVQFQAGLGISLFTTASRTALGPTQPPIQWVTGALSLGVKRPGREADQSPPSSAAVKNAWSYTSTNTSSWRAA
jgi:hypothetical protein